MKALVVGFLTVALYLITALVTGLYNFYWLMDMVNGAPLNVLNLTAKDEALGELSLRSVKGIEKLTIISGPY